MDGLYLDTQQVNDIPIYKIWLLKTLYQELFFILNAKLVNQVELLNLVLCYATM